MWSASQHTVHVKNKPQKENKKGKNQAVFLQTSKVSEFYSKGSHFPILCPAELKRICRCAGISSEHLKTGRFLSGHQWEFYIVKHRR